MCEHDHVFYYLFSISIRSTTKTSPFVGFTGSDLLTDSYDSGRNDISGSSFTVPTPPRCTRAHLDGGSGTLYVSVQRVCT